MTYIPSTTTPISDISSQETRHIINSFCTLVSFYYNKKMNYANVFITVLNNAKLRKIYKELIDETDDYEAIKLFLSVEPNICKSKYISKYLNSHSKVISD